MSLLGLKLFKVLLPLFGFVSGAMVGFVGVQAVFGSGTVSTTMAVVIGALVGVLLSVLSYAFFDLTATIFAAVVGAGAFSYLGVALGLRQEGFLVFLLAVAGAILAAIVAQRYALGVQLIVSLTSLLGVAYVLTGFMLVAGNVTLEQLNNKGVTATLVTVVDQSFLWLLVWIGASVAAAHLQYRLALLSTLSNMFEYQEATARK